MKLPKAKADNIVTRILENETLIYNLTTNQAFCLNETSAKVFEVCNGKRTFGELKKKYEFTDEIIYLALDGLLKEDLITNDYTSPFAEVSRREVIRRVGLASMIALPLISAIIAPHPTHAASDSCRVDGVCYLSGQNFCAGCAGRTVTFDRYTAGSGCQENINDPPASGSLVSNFTDRIRVAVV